MPNIIRTGGRSGALLNNKAPSLNVDADLNNSYSYLKGRMFEKWIDDNSRTNGYNEDDLIECPPYDIESILRDEIFVERDLQITTVTDTTHIIIDELRSSDDDYYNGAVYYNATTLHKTYMTDYVGATKTLVLAVADASAATDDNIFITNIQGSNKVDYASFDVIGNTTNGLRKDWLFARSIYQKGNARDLLASLCFESHCILNFSNQKYKLIALDDGTEDATWTSVAYDGGRQGISSALTPLENVYTSFRLKYHYDYGKGDYVKEWFVDGNGYTTGGTYLGATQQTLCANAKTNYRIVNPFEYGCNWIYDDTTAEMLLVKLVAWFTKQRWITSWTQTFKDYCQYDIGDKIILNYPDFVPDSLNDSAKFMIFGKTITESKGRTFINFNLMEL